MLLRSCLLVAGLLVLSSPQATQAQATNRSLYETLAANCLLDVPGDAEAFYLDAPTAMPYLRTALVEAWQERERLLFVPDSLHAPDRALPRLTYQIEEAGVAYARAPRKQIARTVTLALRYTFTDAEGQLLREDACRDVMADTLARAAIPQIEDAAFPETRSDLPAAGLVRRYLEPAVLTAATAIGVYLFFTLRSQGE